MEKSLLKYISGMKGKTEYPELPSEPIYYEERLPAVKGLSCVYIYISVVYYV